MKKIFLMLACGWIMQGTWAQDLPKWAAKARKAVFSVITYNKDNKIMNTGNGFYIDETGTAVADYTLFKGADHAVIVTTDGKELPVKYIMGANDIYDVVKFKAEYDKKSGALKPASNAPAQGETVYLLPYATQKELKGQNGTIEKIDSIGKDSFYYTLNMQTNDKTVSCPVMNANGEVVALVQKNADAESKQSYAIGIGYASSLAINALSANDFTLRSIGIRKGLPEDEQQALVYLYISSSTVSTEQYLQMLNEFITQYPSNAEGYIRRATCYIGYADDEHYALADQDMNTLLKTASNKAEAHYNVGKLIYSYQLNLGQNKPYKDWTFDKALQEVNAALATAKEPLYYQLQGDIYFAQQKYTEAYAAYAEVNKSPMASASSFYSAAKAKELTEGSDKKEVIALLDSAIIRYNKPYGQDVAPFLYERARVKSDMKDARGAVADYNEFYNAMMGQVSAEFYIIRAQAEIQCRMYQQAIDDVNKAVETDPRNVEYWVEKGSVHLRVNQLEEAEKALRQAISIDPENAPAYRMLGFSLIQMKKKDEGVKLLQKAKDLGDEVADGLIQKYGK